MKRTHVFKAVVTFAFASGSACAGTPTPPAPAPASPVPQPAGATDAGGAPDTAPPATPSKVPPPGDPAACATVVATGHVGNETLRVCLSDERGGVRAPSVVTPDFRNLEESLVAFDASLPAKGLKASFRDVTGDRVEDALVEAPAWKDLTCRYVISGAAMLDVLAGKESYRASASLGLSFAAAIAKGKHDADPWAHAASFTTPISKDEACAIITKAQKGIGAFRQVATDDVEIIDYHEPSRPYCLPKKPNRAATAARLGGTQPIDCKDVTCASDASFCRNHESDPTTDFYLFANEGGRFKIRAIAYLRSKPPP